MASDHNGEGYLSALRTETRADPPTTEEVTSALRDRLRLRLTVRNVAPGHTDEPLDVSPAEPPPQVVWTSVLDTLSTGLQPSTPVAATTTPVPATPVATTAPGPFAAPPPTAPPLISPGGLSPLSPQPFTPQPFSPQPLGRAQPVGDPQFAAAPVAHVGGGQIYVPDGVTGYPSGYDSLPRPPNGNAEQDGPLYIAGPASVVTPNISGMALPYLVQPTQTASPQRIVPSRYLGTPAPSVAVRQPKRRPVRALMSFLVVASLLAGAGFTGWYFLIKNKVTWSTDVSPLATFVETATHADFVDNVSVKTLSLPEYEVKLGIDVLARSYMDPDGSFATLRSVGLVSGTPSPSEVGHVLAAMMTAYYSATDKTIYRIDGTTPVFEVAMLRALTVALADQTSAWSQGLNTATDAQRVAVRASVDTVGVDVVTAKMRDDPQLLSLWAAELQARTAALGVNTDVQPTYLGAVLGSYAVGASTSPAANPASPLAGISLPPSDAPLFDPARSPRVAPAVVTSPVTGKVARTMGMQFWYFMLLPSLGSADARSAALLWDGDAVVTSTVDGRACMNANVATADAASQTALAGYLLRWAQTRPASAGTSITNQSANVVNLSVCEPAEQTAQVTSVVNDTTVIYSAASREEEFGYELIRMGLSKTQGAWSCVVRAYRQGVLPNFEKGSTDPAQADAMLNVLSFCRDS